MKKQSKIAKAAAVIAKAMADKACGAASIWGTYQPKEPAKLQK